MFKKILLVLFAIWLLHDVVFCEAATQVGVIACSLDDLYKEDVVIVRQSPDEVEDELYLYDGDKIKGSDAQLVPYKLYSYGRAQVVNDVVFYWAEKPASWFNNFLDIAKSIVGIDNPDETSSIPGVSKGIEHTCADPLPQPGFYATILPEKPVRFVWGVQNQQMLCFYTDTGNILSEKNVSGMKEITLYPEDIGMLPGNTYTWQLDGIPKKFMIKVLDEDTADKISLELDALAAENGDSQKIKLEQAVYLQKLSDFFPDIFDLYWLSNQYLKEINSQNKNIQYLVDKYMGAYVDHLNHQNKI
jgi:hypothetical protein